MKRWYMRKVQKRPERQVYRNRGPSWTPRVPGEGSRIASSFIFSSCKIIKEDTTLVVSKSTEATLKTRLQERKGKLDPRVSR